MALESARGAMDKAIGHMETELTKIRAGKAHPAMLDSVMVEYYGSMTPLTQVSNINTSDARTLTVQAWEKAMLDPIATAIINANLGLNPMNNGESILINIPPLTEERRKEFCKLASKYAEEGKVALRNLRRDAIDKIKKQEKEGEFSEDQSRDEQDGVQKTLDKFIAELEQHLATKEADILKV